MIESPLIQRIGAEFRRSGQLDFIRGELQDKFGSVGPTIEAGLALVKEETALRRLNAQAVTCSSLRAFEDALLAELPQQPSPSTRGRKKPRKE